MDYSLLKNLILAIVTLMLTVYAFVVSMQHLSVIKNIYLFPALPFRNDSSKFIVTS